MEAPAWLNAELLWRSAAVTAWVAATAMLVWALAAGRSRGRLRCPGGWVLWPRIRVGRRAIGMPWRQGCWYDVSSAPRGAGGAVLCPECGRRHPASSLRRTRRRWRWAAAACALALGGSAMWVAPVVQERGWVRSAPTFVLVEIASVDEWLADQGLVEPWVSAGPVVVELEGRLYGWDADLAAAKRWARRVERRLQRTGRLGVDAASVDAMARLQGAAVTGRFDAAPAAEVFAAIGAASGVELRVDWAGMELAPETPVTIAFDRRRCDLALRDVGWALPRESGAWWGVVDGAARVEHWRVRRDRIAVVDVGELARWLQEVGAELRGSAGCCVEDARCFDLAQTEPVLWPLVEHVLSIEDTITEMVHPEMWDRNGGAAAELVAIGTTIVIAGSAEVVYEAVRLIQALEAARQSGQRQAIDILAAGRLDSGLEWEPERGEPLVLLPVRERLELCDRAGEYCAATAAARAAPAAELSCREGNFCQALGSNREVAVWNLAEAISDTIDPPQWEVNGGGWAMYAFGDSLLIDAPAQAHERITALLDAMRRPQATHQAVEVTGVATEPGHRVRIIPLCGLLLETADRARIRGAPGALEDDLRQYMLPRLKPHDERWSLHFVARMAVVLGDDEVQQIFDDAVEAVRTRTARQ